MQQARNRFVSEYTGEIAATAGLANVGLASCRFFTPQNILTHQLVALHDGTLGKGEVESSILSRGTSLSAKKSLGFVRRYPQR